MSTSPALPDPKPSPEGSAELQQLALDFHAGWFQGDAARLDRVLHPGLSRYLRGRRPSLAAPAAGVPTVEVLDAFGNLACLRLRGPQGKVLLQAVRYGQRWRVVNLMEDAIRVA